MAGIGNHPNHSKTELPKMGNRRFAVVVTSDDEDDASPTPPLPSQRRSPTTEDELGSQLKRKSVRLNDNEDDDDGDDDNNDDDDDEVEPKPLGEIGRVSGKGRWKRNHYSAFENLPEEAEKKTWWGSSAIK